MIIKHNTPIAFDTEDAKSGRKRSRAVWYPTERPEIGESHAIHLMLMAFA
jgi:hypothetical protein